MLKEEDAHLGMMRSLKKSSIENDIAVIVIRSIVRLFT